MNYLEGIYTVTEEEKAEKRAHRAYMLLHASWLEYSILVTLCVLATIQGIVV